MGHRVLHAADAHRRASNLVGVANPDLAGRLGATALGALVVAATRDRGLRTLPPALGGGA